MNSTFHPDRDQLRAYLLGDLPIESLESISKHLSACPECELTVETLENVSDTLLHLLKLPKPDQEISEESACLRAMEIVERLGNVPSARSEKEREASNPTLGRLREYELLSKLGEGGMGAVYKALHPRLDKIVAVKVVRYDRMRDAGAVARFQREMKAVGRLDNPHIVRAMDAGEHEGAHYLVMEYVEGANLSQLSGAVGPLQISDACELIRQAALGLQEAHEHGMVHRDIKPSNLMLTNKPLRKDPPILKILDLGLALFSDAFAPDQPGITSTGQVMGTIDYMAPEQGSDSHLVDIRADIYSLGATLYKLLTGRAPFEGERYDTPVKKLMALATKSPPALSTYRGDVPPELAQILERMMAKDPAERFATPAEVALAVEPYCADANLAALSGQLGVKSAWDPDSNTVQVSSASCPTSSSPNRMVLPPTRTAPPEEQASLTPEINPAYRHLTATVLWASVLGTLALLVGMGAIILIPTPDGLIQIEIHDPDIRVTIDNHGATFEGVDQQHRIEIQPGEHGLTITRGDLVFDTDKFVLTRGETVRLKVLYLAGRIQVTHNGQPLAGQLTGDLPPTPPAVPNAQPELVASAIPEPIASPPPSDEPPPLEEWLKGREILTVAQDGSGQFNSIGEALKFLKSGQVVQVLDQGPYQERLDVNPPPNTGLISLVRTIVELDDWREYKDAQNGAWQLGHFLSSPDGFRLSGFDLSVPRPVHHMKIGLIASSPSGFLLENCRLSPACYLWIGRNFASNALLRSPARNFIRDSHFRSSIHLNGTDGHPMSITLVRNFFDVSGEESKQWTRHITLYSESKQRFSALSFRHNVFGEQARCGILTSSTAIQKLEICKNTFLSRAAVIVKAIPGEEFIARNNLHQGNGLVIVELPEEDFREVSRGWNISHNGYAELANQGFPRAATDVVAKVSLLSTNPDHTNFARIGTGEPFAKAGAGGETSDYLGAIPPGPAPESGDWLTRLQKSWNSVPPKPAMIAAPSRLDEPPPLEEWLKGREILTVAQDGRGQFKTIQAALDALKPGQVVKVLDKGPYRESIRLNKPPKDIGLVSEQQTVLEIAKWTPYTTVGSKFEYRHGHQVISPQGFRLSGFSIGGSSAATKDPHSAFYIEGGSHVVVEDSRVQIEIAGPDGYPRISAIRINGFGRDPQVPTVVRDCVLKGKLDVVGWPDTVAAPFYVRRNYINSENEAFGIAITGQIRRAFVQHNIIKASLKAPGIVIAMTPGTIPPEMIEITNNTVIGPVSNRIQNVAPPIGVTIRDNVLPVFQLMFGAENHREAIKDWTISGNWYPIRPESLPRSANCAFRRPDDPQMEFRFVSEDSSDPNFARLDVPHGTDAPGALPTGPTENSNDWFTQLRKRWITNEMP